LGNAILPNNKKLPKMEGIAAEKENVAKGFTANIRLTNKQEWIR